MTQLYVPLLRSSNAMATVLQFFFVPEDEVAFFRTLERLRLEVYPSRVPPDWKPFWASAETVPRLPEEAAYLAASDIGPVQVDRIKRGPDKGAWRVDEVRSPVLYYERSHTDDEGALLPGRLWAELEVTPQTGRRTAAPDLFRRLVLEVEAWFKKTCRRGDPKGYWIGPAAARRFKEGLVMKDPQLKGEMVRPHR
jgi:hypothetical protein